MDVCEPNMVSGQVLRRDCTRSERISWKQIERKKDLWKYGALHCAGCLSFPWAPSTWGCLTAGRWEGLQSYPAHQKHSGAAEVNNVNTWTVDWRCSWTPVGGCECSSDTFHIVSLLLCLILLTWIQCYSSNTRMNIILKQLTARKSRPGYFLYVNTLILILFLLHFSSIFFHLLFVLFTSPIKFDSVGPVQSHFIWTANLFLRYTWITALVSAAVRLNNVLKSSKQKATYWDIFLLKFDFLAWQTVPWVPATG